MTSIRGGRQWMQEIPIHHVIAPSHDRHINNTFPDHSAKTAVYHDGKTTNTTPSAMNGANHTDTWRITAPQTNSRYLTLSHKPKQQTLRQIKHSPSYHDTMSNQNRSNGRQMSHDQRPHDKGRSNSHRGLQRANSISSQASESSQQSNLRHQPFLVKPRPLSAPATQKSMFIFPTSEPARQGVSNPALRHHHSDRGHMRWRESSPVESVTRHGQSPSHQTLRHRHSSPVRQVQHLSTQKGSHTPFYPVQTSTPNSKSPEIVQETFLWQHENEPDSFKIRRGSKSESGQPSWGGHSGNILKAGYDSDTPMLQLKKNAVAPPVLTKSPQQPSTPNHHRSMPLVRQHSSTGRHHNMIHDENDEKSNLRDAGRPPMAPNQNMRRDQRPLTYHFEKANRHPYNNDSADRVIYTEIKPQNHQNRHSAHITDSTKKGLMRTRSSSPVIYTEVIPSDHYRPREATLPRAPSSHRASMTFGDDISVCDSEAPSTVVPQYDTLKHRSLRRTDSNIRAANKENQQGKAGEYTVGLGPPSLQLQQINGHIDLNNNSSAAAVEHYDNVQTSFPNSASLEQMLDSDTSLGADSSKTMKSALKQPSKHKNGISLSKKPQKRVTIKETDRSKDRSSKGGSNNRKLSGYESKPVNGLTLKSVNRQHPPQQINNNMNNYMNIYPESQTNNSRHPYLIYPSGLRVVKNGMIR